MNKILLATVGIVTLANLTLGVGCAPDPKSPDEWRAKIAPMQLEARKPAFQACFAQERARVASFPDSDPNKTQFQAFLSRKVVVTVHLRVDQMSNTPDRIRAEDGSTPAVRPGPGQGDDGPLADCVQKAMRGLTQPFGGFYPSDGTWTVVFDPSVMTPATASASGPPAATSTNGPSNRTTNVGTSASAAGS